jgi:glycosyltransferase involved in cell wall biosynthesis
MKILLAHKFFYKKGGAELFFQETGKVLKENGHQVAYFSTQDKKNPFCEDISFFVKSPAYESGNIFKRIHSLGNIIYSHEAKKQFSRLLKSFKPDIVHMFSIYVQLSPSILEACKEAGVPVVMSCNDYKHICPNYLLYYNGHICEDCKGGKFYHAVLNRCCKNSLVFSVGSTLEAYIHHFWNIYRKNIHTFLFASNFMAHKTEEFWGKGTFRWGLLTNPFDSSKYPLQREYGDYFLYFGRLKEEKGVDMLLHAMRELPETKLLIVGEGPQEAMLKEIVVKCNLNNVSFLGPKWGKEIEDILKKCRFVVVPSIWHENFPYVIFQAFSFGKPVIATNRGGIPELVKDKKFGLIYNAEDPHALAASIKNLWNDPSFTVKIGEAAKNYIDEQFNYEKFYKDLIEIYKGVIK